MVNILRSYLGLDKEPETEPKPDPSLEETTKKTTSKFKLVSAHKHKEEKENGNE